MKIYLAHSTSFGFKEKFYSEIKNSNINKEHQIFLPEDRPEEDITKDMIEHCDAVIADVSYPSLGVGIEIGWADAALVPVIAMSEKGTKVSDSIRHAISQQFVYENSGDMIIKLEQALQKYS